MKSQVAQCQKCCDDLKHKFNTRLNMEIEAVVKRIEGDSMYCVHDDVYFLRINSDGCSCQYSKSSKDKQGWPAWYWWISILSDNINDFLLITAEKVLKWLSAPDSSKNYNEAREKHQKDTCSWFLNGTWFHDLQDKAGILWIKGIGRLSNKHLALWLCLVLNNYTAGCGKTILWWVLWDHMPIK